MNWRPEGWENPHEEYHDICDVPTVQDAEYEAFESGADEMLEGLFQMARESPTGTFTIDVREQNIYMENNNEKK